mgnify:CR=1 FL=1
MSENTEERLERIQQDHPYMYQIGDMIASQYKVLDHLGFGGFSEVYKCEDDLGRIVLNAMSEIQLGDDMVKNRRLLRDKLESMDKPVQGLIKKYQKPFTAFSPDEPDAHEALGLSDLCMASFNKLGVIEVKNNLAK